MLFSKGLLRLNTMQKILIIDDDARLVKNVETYLKDFGYRIDSALNGADGLRKVQVLQPDLVLLDLMMPEVDGFQVLETIKADKELANTRIIVITAKTLSAGERRRLSGQIELLLQKGSFLDDELLEEILATLKEK